MKHKKTIYLFILSITLLGNSEKSHAQFFKKLKDKAVKVATETANEIISKEKKNSPSKTKTPEANKENNPVVTKKTESTKEQWQEIDYSDVYTIKSPNPVFKSIHLQAHKGLLRFGSQNPYYVKNRYGRQSIDIPKNSLLKEGYKNYSNLLKMRFLIDYYKDINRTTLTILTQGNIKNTKEIHSSVAQKHLLNTSYGLATKNIFRAFFCDLKNNPNCNYSGSGGGLWSGTRNEFEE
ncbi:MAG: hypothetical protein V3U92_17350 [Cellulophaga sp.]